MAGAMTGELVNMTKLRYKECKNNESLRGIRDSVFDCQNTLSECPNVVFPAVMLHDSTISSVKKSQLMASKVFPVLFLP